MRSVFLVYFELGAASRAFTDKGLAGGFVTVAVTADDIFESIDLASKALADDGYVIREIDKVIKFDPKEWRHDAAILELVTEAQSDASEVFYSNFETYGH